MSAWFETLFGPEYAAAAIWILSGILLLILLVVAMRLLRGLASGTFVTGGRHRRTRLAVMDAAAVDNRRRLVLVRRDDVEHLILIGGPTDLVVEQDIRMVTPGRRHTDVTPEVPAAREEAPPPVRKSAPEVARPRLVSPPAPMPAKPAEPAAFAAGRNGGYHPRPAPASAPASEPADRSIPAAMTPQQVAAPPAAAPQQRQEPVFHAPKQAAEPAVVEKSAVVTPLPIAREENRPAAARPASLEDDALLRELEVTLDAPDRRSDEKPSATKPDSGPDDISLEEEMSKLLGDLSGDRR